MPNLKADALWSLSGNYCTEGVTLRRKAICRRTSLRSSCSHCRLNNGFGNPSSDPRSLWFKARQAATDDTAPFPTISVAMILQDVIHRISINGCAKVIRTRRKSLSPFRVLAIKDGGRKLGYGILEPRMCTILHTAITTPNLLPPGRSTK
jgi:hypothetical protein